MLSDELGHRYLISDATSESLLGLSTLLQRNAPMARTVQAVPGNTPGIGYYNVNPLRNSMNNLSHQLSRALASAVITAAAIGGNAFAATCAGAKCSPKQAAAAGCRACKAGGPKAKAKKMAACGAAKCAAKCGACAGKKQ